MTEQEWCDVADLRAWRIVNESVQWIISDTSREVQSLALQEIARLEDKTQLETET